MKLMKYIIFLLLITLLFIQNSLADTENTFEKKASKENNEAMKNEKIKCRWVCDKKLYKEQKISEAVSFYKNSKDYTFTKESF